MSGKPSTKAPAPPLAALCLGLLGEKLRYEPGHGQGAGHGVGHYLSRSLRPCVCYNSGSGLDEGASGSCPGCKSTPLAAPVLSEGVP